MSSTSSIPPKSAAPKLFSKDARPAVNKRDAGILPAPAGLPALIVVADAKDRALPVHGRERALPTAVLPAAPKLAQHSTVGQKLKSLPVPPLTVVQKPVVVVKKSRLVEFVTPRNTSSLICNTVMPLALAAVAAALSYLLVGQYVAAVLGVALLVSLLVERIGQRLLDALIMAPPQPTLDAAEEKRLARQHEDDQTTIAALNVELSGVQNVQQLYDAFRERSSAQLEAAAQTRRHLQGKVEAAVADKEKSDVAHNAGKAKLERAYQRRLTDEREGFKALQAEHAEELEKKDEEIELLEDDLQEQFSVVETLKNQVADSRSDQARLHLQLRELKTLFRTIEQSNDELSRRVRVAESATRQAAQVNAISAKGTEQLSYVAANMASIGSMVTGFFTDNGIVGDIEQPLARRQPSRFAASGAHRAPPSLDRVSPAFGPVSELKMPQSPVPQSPEAAQLVPSSSTQSTPTSPRSPASATESNGASSNSDVDVAVVASQRRQSKPRKKHFATIVG